MTSTMSNNIYHVRWQWLHESPKISILIIRDVSGFEPSLIQEWLPTSNSKHWFTTSYLQSTAITDYVIGLEKLS